MSLSFAMCERAVNNAMLINKDEMDAATQ